MKLPKHGLIVWSLGMFAAIFIAIHFSEWLEWDTFLAGLVYSLTIGLYSILTTMVSD